MLERTAFQEPDIASTAALIGEPSRAVMLSALMDGRALPAGQLAGLARVTPQTASSHLDKLVDGGLLRVEVQGRHRYYRLAGQRVADLLESLAVVARPAGPPRRDALAQARTCYGHLAGRLGVSVTEALVAKEILDASLMPTKGGRVWFRELGIEVEGLKRRPLSRPCLDWSERRHHLAGALGVALASRMFELRWLARAGEGRAVRLTAEGGRALRSRLGLAFDF